VTDDLVIVIPGIMGSELVNRESKPVWSLRGGSLLRAIATFGRSITSLELPAGVGDEPPDDGVTASALMGDLHVIPGLWRPIAGYTSLLEFLSGPRVGLTLADPRNPDVVPNLIAFPYDWRLSCRYNGARLAALAAPALERWRRHSGRPQARLVLLCHSLGGLVARWFLEREGGAELTRALITIGTPHLGSVKALGTLVNGIERGLGPLSLSLTAFARSLPSLHQLLPTYRCLDSAQGRQTLLDAGAPGLDTAMVQDAARFHEQIEPSSSSTWALHKVVGIRQATLTSARFDGGVLTLLDTIDGKDQEGDGTVPRHAAEPKLGRGKEVHEVAQQHGELQVSRSTLDLVDGIITRQSLIWESPAATGFGVTMDDLHAAGSAVPLRVEHAAGRRLLVTVLDEKGAEVGVRVPVRSDGVAELPALPPGGYRARVAATSPGGPSPVTHPFVVLPDPAELA
jgi:lecithin:cholesterol acyltransferase